MLNRGTAKLLNGTRGGYLLEVIVFDTRVISCPLRLVRTDEKVLLTCELGSRRNEVTRIAETLQNRFNFIRGDLSYTRTNVSMLHKSGW